MNFLELANRVLKEAESHNVLRGIESIPIGQEAPEAHRRAVEWVAEAYGEIQRQQDHWKFHHNTGTFFTTSSNTSDYAVSAVRNTKPEAFLCKESGSTYNWPLIWMPYQHWLDTFRIAWEQYADGTPIYITRMPDDDFRLTPAPVATRTFVVSADWYRTNHKLELITDEPLWDEEFHELVVWVALESYAEEYDVAPLRKRLTTRLPRLWASFKRRYLPELTE